MMLYILLQKALGSLGQAAFDAVPALQATIYVYMCVCMYVYIYIYIEREREI